MSTERLFYWFLSFRNTVTHEPLGACVVPILARQLERRPETGLSWLFEPDEWFGFRLAMGVAWSMGCNPGGEVEGTYLGKTSEGQDLEPGRLYSPTELKALGFPLK